MSKDLRNFVTEESDDLLDLSEHIDLILSKWKIVLLLTIFSACISVWYALKQPNLYLSEAVLSGSQTASSQNGIMGGLGSLAQVAGVSFGSQDIDKTKLAIEIMKSRQFISRFVSENDLVPEIVAAESWNPKTDIIKYNEEIFNSSERVWTQSYQRNNNKSAPSQLDIVESFNRLFQIYENKENGLIYLSILHFSPTLAKKIVDKLITSINDEMKSRDIEQAKNSIHYLNKQLEITFVTENRNVLLNLLEEQARNMMLSEVREQYVFEVTDPAIIPEKRSKPNRALICIVGTVIGFILSILIVLIYFNIFKPEKVNDDFK